MSQSSNNDNKNKDMPYSFGYTKDHPKDYSSYSGDSYSRSSGGSSHHHSSDGSSHHHSSESSSSHHRSSGSSSSSHHHSSESSSSSHHHSSGSSSSSHHHSSGSSSSHHHSSGSSSSSHHSSGSRGSSSSSGSHRSGDSKYNYSSSSSAKDSEKIDKLSEKYSSNEDKEEKIKEIQKRLDKRNKKSKIKKIILGIFLGIILLIFIAAITILIMVHMGKKNLLDYDNVVIETIDDAETEDDGKIVYYKGKKYKLNENMTSIACLGIDKNEIDQHGIVGSAGQADTIMVIAFDTASGYAKIIPIPRDSIAEVDVYDKDGDFIRKDQTQVCLAYAYGDGGETSCSNVISSVQKLMFGIPVKAYGALDLAGISVLNDAVGGVTVTPEDSFSKFTAGQTVTLHGNDAVAFVRTRDTQKLDSNIGRMDHQIMYVKAFTNVTVSKAREDLSIINTLYETASDYSYTDITLGKALYLATRFISTQTADFSVITVPGETVEGKDGYAEFIIDRVGFYEELLSVYYTVIGTY